MIKLSPLLLCILVLAPIFGLIIICTQNPFKTDPKQILSNINQQNDYQEDCDLFNGSWVADKKGPSYTNWSYKTIPDSKNCFRNGRQDSGFVNWRWKPYECEHPRFDPKVFLRLLRGKKMAFIGDSLARNHMESLLCLLSKAHINIEAQNPGLLGLPIKPGLDSEDRFRTWRFPRHNLTLEILWSKFLVVGKERVINGSDSGIYDLQLDKVDEKWSKQLPSIEYAIISDAHWFFRKIYLHQGTYIIGCVYCEEPNITQVDLKFALRMSFRVALDHINRCKSCEKMVTIVRTFSPSHFEYGAWDNGGRCNRTSPLNENNVVSRGFDLDIRGIHVEETERANKKGRRFKILDITRAMHMRPDAHPGSFWGNKWMKGYDDCVHWCMPGPIDTWNDLLIAILKKNRHIPNTYLE